MEQYFTPIGYKIVSVFGFLISVLFLYIIWIASDTTRRTMKIIIYKLKQWLRQVFYALRLTFKIFKVVRKSYFNYVQEIIFAAYVNFYDNHYSSFDDMGFDASIFPNGSNDLMCLNRWIKKTRVDNYSELNNLEFVEKKDDRGKTYHYISYWGTKYNTFKFKIDEKGQLRVFPGDDVIENVEVEFRKNRMKLENALYNLDTQKCNWIVERRKHLML